ncbi:MAG: betaine/proline/choline family ABC transporter ATP-binding protein [Firmicutes bacterium]|nr:betaine/proline/choline family ABC transporter ATP-binding protein [Bacillota bacterium]
MIELQSVTKKYPGSDIPAVNNLSFEIPEGEICILVGPSGCGKTTTMKMINRLIVPTSGKIKVNGTDISTVNPIELRRNIGYVIQEIGLFPHMTIRENIAIVPTELKWPKKKINQRVEELLDLVGLDPAIYADRYPRDLSGGQRQRVGVARAMAADPPVMLMDEPFGALDPINRSRIQNEFLRIQEKVRKTIVFVTHDIDEAIKMGDRIAVMRQGSLVQYASPGEILSDPADEFVENLVGKNRTIKRLNLLKVEEAMEDILILDSTISLADAASAMDKAGADIAAVKDSQGRFQGVVPKKRIRRALARSWQTTLSELADEPDVVVDLDTTLHDVLSEMMQAGEAAAFVVEANQCRGMLTLGSIVETVSNNE